jgi:uncharacterized protein (DUF2235 family)
MDMKRLVICCDGTWNRADQVEKDGRPCVSNVIKIAVRVAKRDGATPQIVYYDQGVGTGNFFDRVDGGITGAGLEENIHDAYRFVVANYELGDELYFFGFSRGAFTARSITGMIRKCGILTRKHVEKYHEALDLYRSADHPDEPKPVAFRKEHSMSPVDPIDVKFIGVWDTVGALGIPLHVLQDVNMKFYEFHDTKLSNIVDNAYHALAVDEYRLDYRATLWDPDVAPTQNLEQRWFIGAHCDVGGGYTDRRLSDMTLRWMQDKASALGLALDPTPVGAQNYLGVYTDSYAKFLDGLYARRNPRYYRPVLATKFGHEVVDDSVQRRRKEDHTYEPQNNGLPKLS